VAVGGLRIVDQPARRAPSHRLRHLVRWVLGLVLLLASVIAALPAVFVVLLTIVVWLAGSPPDLGSIEGRDAAFLAAVTAGAVVLGWLAVRLLRGRRHLVLFLRRFGFTPATEALTVAAAGSLGRGWRLVTLDDREVAPVGVNRGSRWAVRLLWLLALVALVAAVWYSVNWITGDAFDRAVRDAVDEANESSTEDNPIAAALGAIVVTMVVAMVVAVVSLLALMVPVVLAGTATLFLGISSRSVRRAERAKAVLIDEPHEVEAATRAIRRRVRRIFSPRMTVARVTNPLWQDVVRRLAEMSDGVIVDVSSPSPNLLWELHTLDSEGVGWLPVGRADRLTAVAVDASPVAVELRRLLGDREVLAYTPERLEPFADALRASLELAAAARPA
jgi:hypothetical protein